MPTFLQMALVLFGSLAGFLPYLLLILYPFRNHMRFKGIPAGALSVVAVPALLYLDAAAAFGTAQPLPAPLPQVLILLVFAIVSIQAPIQNVLFSSCSAINLMLLIHGAAGWLAAYGTLKHFLVTLLLQLIVLLPYTFLLAKTIAPTLNISDAPIWKKIWDIPAICTAGGLGLVWLSNSPAALALITAFLVAASAAATAACLYFTKTEMITLTFRKPKPAVTPVAPAVVVPDSAEIYYENLLKRVAEAQHSTQELLLQVMSMEDDLNNEDYTQLRARLNTLRNQLTPDAAATGNSQIDPIVAHYIRQGTLSGVKMAVKLELPEWTSVPDGELAAIIGSLMDNALDACRAQTSGTRRIAAATNMDSDLLQIGIKNTHSEPMDPDSAGVQLCRQIAARHGGKVEITGMEGVSQIVVTLNI